MYIFKDLFTETEIFSDAFKIELVDDVYYKVSGKYRVDDRSVDDSLIGGNKSAEAEGDDNDADSAQVLIADILGEMKESFQVCSKKEWTAHIKDYMKKLLPKIAETDQDRADFLKKELNEKFAKPVLQMFKDKVEFSYYSPLEDEANGEGMIILFAQEEKYEKVDTKCYMIVLKDGCIKEAV